LLKTNKQKIVTRYFSDSCKHMVFVLIITQSWKSCSNLGQKGYLLLMVS